VDAGCGGTYCLDAFARPTHVTRSSTVGNAARHEVTAYHDDLQLWVLGQQASLSVNGVLASGATFDARAQPTVLRAFGRITQGLSYWADGTLASVTAMAT